MSTNKRDKGRRRPTGASKIQPALSRPRAAVEIEMTATEAANGFGALLRRVTFGDRVVVTQHGQRVAVVTRVEREDPQ